jgi:effector-binding domain-containing protein
MTEQRQEPEITTAEAVTTAAIRRTVPMSELADFYDTAYRELAETLAAQGVRPSGPAFGLYHGAPAKTADVEAGFATDRAVEPAGGVIASSLPGGRVARLVHHGAYDALGESWERLHLWVVEQGLRPGDVMWEVYVTEPSPDIDPAELRTELNLAVSG